MTTTMTTIIRNAVSLFAARMSCLAALTFACAAARAQGPAPEPSQAPPPIVVVGDCPGSGTLSTVLAPLLSKAASAAPTLPPRVTDLGERFEVAVAGQSGLYLDINRDCVERARIAAVFIALVLTTPTFRVAAPQAVLPAAAPQPSPPAPPPERWAAASIAARCDATSAGSSSSPVGLACGGELDGSVGKGGYGAFLSASALTSTVTTLASVPVHVQRFPLALGVVAARNLRAGWRVGANVGAALELLRIQGQGLDTTQPALRFDAGARIGVSLRLPTAWRGWAPAMTVHGEYFPRAYQIDVAPLGTIGSLGRYSVGVAAGVSYRGVSANSYQ